MAISIIVGLSVAIMMIVIMHLLYDKVEEENSVSGLKFNDYFRAIGTGVAVGGVNFLAPKVTRLLPAVILLVVMIVIFVMLTKWWHEEGWDLNGLIPFIILIALLIFPTMSAAAAVNRFISNQFLISLIKIIPLMLAIVAVGFAVIDFFHLRYTKMDKNDESAYRRHRLGATIAAIATGVALLCLIVFGFRNPQRVIAADELTPEEVAAEEELETGKEDKEEVILDALENLTVVKLSVEELERLTLEKYVNISQVFLDSSLSSKDKERTEKTGFSDALTFGFNSKDETEMFKELEEEILRNPVYGVTVANAIKDKTIGDKRIGDLNPWMDEMVKLNDENGVSYWLEYRDSEKKTIYVTDEYRQYAATLCTWLERLVSQGVKAKKTSENWCLNAAATNNDRKGVKASYQYEKDALILTYVGKDGSSLFTIGFNIHDKRPEFYLEPTPNSSPSPSVNPSPNPSPNPTPNPTPDPTPKPPTPTPDPTPTPKPPTPTPDPTPTPTPPTPTPKPPKDPGKAPPENTEPNDDPGPGPDTNSGKGSNESTKDQSTNSNHYKDYNDYKDDIGDLEETNKNQKTGNDNNKPSTPKPDPGTKVDNNGDSGTGNGGINNPTPTQEKAKEAETGKEISDKPGEAWGGPPD